MLSLGHDLVVFEGTWVVGRCLKLISGRFGMFPIVLASKTINQYSLVIKIPQKLRTRCFLLRFRNLRKGSGAVDV